VEDGVYRDACPSASVWQCGWGATRHETWRPPPRAVWRGVEVVRDRMRAGVRVGMETVCVCVETARGGGRRRRRRTRRGLCPRRAAGSVMAGLRGEKARRAGGWGGSGVVRRLTGLGVEKFHAGLVHSPHQASEAPPCAHACGPCGWLHTVLTPPHPLAPSQHLHLHPTTPPRWPLCSLAPPSRAPAPRRRCARATRRRALARVWRAA
jgi:hypothetical protein